VIVYLPALRSPYFLDDYVHAWMAEGTFPTRRSPFDLYNFINDADRPVLVARGMLPWWADPRLSIRFFRPLSSALIWGEHWLFGDRALLLHLHSLLWWAAAVLGARALFKRLLPSRPARLATVVFALAPCHAFPLGWLANREALVSLAFGIPALGAYLSFREGRLARHGLLAAALFALAMLGGEYAFCLTGYVLALELVARGGRRWGSARQEPSSAPNPGDSLGRRVLGLAPFVVPGAAYLAVRGALGYGTRGSGFYSDPFRETPAFLGWLPRPVATLLLDGWFSLDHDTLTYETPRWQIALGLVAAVALLAPPILRVLRRGPPAAGWLLLGSFLAVAPVTAVISSPRLLGASMIGVAAIVALLLDQAWFTVAAEGPRTAAAEHAATAALVMGFAHLVHGPVTAFLVSMRFRAGATSFAEHSAELRTRLAEPGSGEPVVVRGMAGAMFLPWVDRRSAPPVPWHILAQTGHVLALRVDARTVDLIAPANHGLFSLGGGNLWRSETSKMPAGTVVRVPGMRVSVLESSVDGPRRVRFELDRDLDSPTLLWLSEDHAGDFPDAPPPQQGFGKPFDP
jgi:hypothetical protein